MYNSPYIVGINQELFTPGSIDDRNSLIKLGNNTGNILFSESLYRNISGARRGTVHFEQKDLAGVDVIVVAAANWLNSSSDWGWLADKIAKTGLPLVIVGLGAQSDEAFNQPRITPGTMRLVKLASETSKLISTRGWFTSEVLERVGIGNSLVTGCPSLLLCGPKSTRLKTPANISSDSAVLHGTRHLIHNTSAPQKYFYRQSIERDIDLLIQSELADVLLARREAGSSEEDIKIAEVLTDVYNSDPDSIREYLKRRMKIFYRFESMIEYFKGKDFSVGTRLHGTVAALIAGVPAVLVTHDSRTVEAGEALNIPMVRLSSIDLERDLDLQAIYDQADFSRYEMGYMRYRRNFMSFLQLNGLTPGDGIRE